VQAEKLSTLFPVRRGLFGNPRFVHAVDGVSFYIRRGETLGLVGESGCGKSTLGRTLLRLIEPTLGRIIFDGRDITRLPDNELRPMRRRMQIVFQDPYSSLNPRMTVREIVGEGISVFRLAATRADHEAKVADVLTRVGLRPDMMGRYPHEFSGGQRQRIGIARALALRPDFIVCDEPISALDLSVQAQIMNLLEELQDELSLSLLFISHDLRATSYMSHRIAVMYLGKIVEMGPTGEVQEKRYHPYTRALFSAIPASEVRAPGSAQASDPGPPPVSGPMSGPMSGSASGFSSVPPPSMSEPGYSSDPGSVSAPESVPAPGSVSAPRSMPAPRTASASASQRRLPLQGEPPSAIEPPSGCVFHTRCPKAEKGRCDVEVPVLEEIIPGSHHRVACWYPELD
jgi:oligopeptide transport system ATP-binding protein